MQKKIAKKIAKSWASRAATTLSTTRETREMTSFTIPFRYPSTILIRTAIAAIISITGDRYIGLVFLSDNNENRYQLKVYDTESDKAKDGLPYP